MTTPLKVRALVIPVDGKPVVQDITPTLKSMYQICGEPIQMVPYLNGEVDLVCNEEGKLTGLPPNRPAWNGADVICGQFFFIRHDDEGECASLTDEDIKRLTEEFA